MFLIQASSLNGLPATAAGDSFIRAISEQNWYERKIVYSYDLTVDFANWPADINIIPVGTVEFCLEWYKKLGLSTIAPLNIPEILWPFCKREVLYTKELKGNEEYFLKDKNIIKCETNGVYCEYSGEEKFATKYIRDIVSEWRLFVSRGRVAAMKNYAGDEWATPDRSFCIEVAKKYGVICPSFTLDVMVLESGETDIVELHDFFACGLYGFDEAGRLLRMAIDSHRYILDKYRKEE